MDVNPIMRITLTFLFSLLALHGQGTVPTFTHATYTLVGGDPAKGGTTTIPMVLVPVTLSFAGKPFAMDAAADVPALLRSPVFAKFAFAVAGSSTVRRRYAARRRFPRRLAGTRCWASPR